MGIEYKEVEDKLTEQTSPQLEDKILEETALLVAKNNEKDEK